jgi:hypothetical protein
MTKAAVVTYKPLKGQRDRDPTVSQEESLFGLLRQAEGYAYALAHGYDIRGQPDRAYAFVALGERLHNAAGDVSDLARPLEPHIAAPVLGLRSRALSLRRLLRETAWEGPGVVPFVPWLADERPSSRTRKRDDRFWETDPPPPQKTNPQPRLSRGEACPLRRPVQSLGDSHAITRTNPQACAYRPATHTHRGRSNVRDGRVILERTPALYMIRPIASLDPRDPLAVLLMGQRSPAQVAMAFKH